MEFGHSYLSVSLLSNFEFGHSELSVSLVSDFEFGNSELILFSCYIVW